MLQVEHENLVLEKVRFCRYGLFCLERAEMASSHLPPYRKSVSLVRVTWPAIPIQNLQLHIPSLALASLHKTSPAMINFWSGFVHSSRSPDISMQRIGFWCKEQTNRQLEPSSGGSQLSNWRICDKACWLMSEIIFSAGRSGKPFSAIILAMPPWVFIENIRQTL